MNTTQIFLLCLCGAFFLIVAPITAIGDRHSLKENPNKSVGSGHDRAFKAEPVHQFRVGADFVL